MRRRSFSVVGLVTAVLALSSAVLAQQAEAQTVGFENPIAATVRASEGDKLVYTVVLSAQVDQDVVLGYSTTGFGTARSGVDYQAEDGSRTVTIPTGNLRATFEIVSIEDSTPEVDELLLLRLVQTSAGLPRGVTLGLSNGTGTIVNDDAPITISIQDASAPKETTSSSRQCCLIPWIMI